MGALVGARGHEDVAQAARRERALRARLLEQRDQLAGELRAPEREQLDEHDGGPRARQRCLDPLGAGAPGALGRVARVAAPEAASGPDAQRRQRHQLDAVRRGDPLGQLAAAQQDDTEALGQPVAQRV